MERRARLKAAHDLPWSDDEVAELRRLRREGASTRLISFRLNRTVRAIEMMDSQLRLARERGR